MAYDQFVSISLHAGESSDVYLAELRRLANLFDIVEASKEKAHLQSFGLIGKPPERLVDGARVLSLRVWGVRGGFFWRKYSKVADVPNELTRRSIFSYCGKLVGH